MKRSLVAVGAFVLGSAVIGLGAPTPIGFGTLTHLPGQAGYMIPAIADATGDGKPDVVLAGYYTTNLRVHPGNGDGTFGEALTFPQSFEFANRVHPVRLNADSADDFILSVVGTPVVMVFLSNGTGGFAETVSTPADAAPNENETAVPTDWDGDGDIDILTVNTSKIRLRVNDGTGHFGAAQNITSSFPGFAGAGYSGAEMVVSDLDGDGDQDVYFSYGRIFWRGTDGTFTGGPSFLTGVGRWVIAADLDGDGFKDLAGLVQADFPYVPFGTEVNVLRHTSATEFGEQVSYRVSSKQVPWGVVATDLDGDSRPELVTSNSVLMNAGDGTFGPPLTLPEPGASGYWGIVAGDLYGDSGPELVSTWVGNVSFTTSATVIPVIASTDLPSISALSPEQLFVGASRDVVLSGAGFQSGIEVDLGDGLVVESTTRESSGSLRVHVTIDDEAAAGAREAIVRNPDGGTASIDFTVATGGGATFDSLTPDREHAGASFDVTVAGAGFVDGATASLGDGVTVNEVTVLSDDEIRLSVTVDLSASVGSRDLVLQNGSGIATTSSGAFTVLPARSVDLTVTRGRLRGASRPGRGAVTAAGTLGFNALSPDARFDAASEPLQLRVGDPAAPLVIDVPADIGWRIRGDRAEWKSARGAPGPRAHIVLDFAKNTFRVEVKRADFPTPPEGDLLVELSLGTETGTSVRQWTSRRGEFVLR